MTLNCAHSASRITARKARRGIIPTCMGPRGGGRSDAACSRALATIQKLTSRALAGRHAVVGVDLDPRRAPRRQPSGEAPLFAGRHGPLELAADAVHVNLIPQLAAHHATFAPPPDLFESGLLVSPDPCWIPFLLRGSGSRSPDISKSPSGESFTTRRT